MEPGIRVWLWETEMMPAWTSSEPAWPELGLSKTFKQGWGQSSNSCCPLGKIHQAAVPDQLGVKGPHTTETTIKLALIGNCSWATKDWMGHEDWTPHSPQGSQISTKITCIKKKRIIIILQVLGYFKMCDSVTPHSRAGMAFHQYYAFAEWWKALVWSLVAEAAQSQDFF